MLTMMARGRGLIAHLALPGALRDELPFLVGITAGLTIAILGYGGLRAELIPANDFSYVWASGRALLDGLDPYRPSDWEATIARYGTQRGHEDHFIFGPWIALAFVPFAAMPLALASEVWTLGTMLFAAVALRALLRAVAPGFAAVQSLAGLSLFASQPGIASYWSGQWGFLHVAALCLAVVGVRHGGPASAGLLATLGKPHLFVFAWLGILRAHVASGRPWLALALAAAAAIVIAATSAILSGWAGPVASVAPRYAPSMMRKPTTLAVGLEDLIGPAGGLLAAAIVVVGAIAAIRVDPRSDRALAVWIALSVTSALWAFSYDHLALVVPLVLAVGVIARASSDRVGVVAPTIVFGLFLLGPALLTIPANERANESYSALVPLAVLGFTFVAAQWPEAWKPKART